MANKLRVDELRTQLAQRGLDTSGTKPALVLRLESAIRDEEKSLKGKDAAATNRKKRGRDSEDARNSDGSDLIRDVEKLREMNAQQLRDEAVRRGIASTGSKKELLKRICDDCEKKKEEEAEDETDACKDGNVVTKEKIVTATKKGSAVLDQWLPDHIKAQYHVLQVGDEIYDAMLNQTNVGFNNNKFYVIQALESDGGGSYMVYSRWGRVGVKGQDDKLGPYTSKERAIREFEQKFFSKTKNYWSNRKEFICRPKSYTWLEMDYSKNEKELSVNEKRGSTSEVQPRETKLEPRIAKFISLISNMNMMKQQMMEIGYNAEKLPLGKLSKSTILKGYEVLKRIADVITQSNRSQLEQLSGEFYTVIPHDFGFKNMREFVIDTPQKLKSKLEMVEALGEIELATKLLEDVNSIQEDPLSFHYQRLHCELSPVEVDSEEFSMVSKYAQNTHAKTHSKYTVDIVQIFKLSREGENERFKKFSNTKNRKLLWHGSRLTNWTGILSQGLRIAPPEAPVTGYMFGKGVYFADMFSKSANYCYASNAATTGVLLLCEVALGDMVELLDANYDADKLPEGKLSTKGVGQTEPNPSEAVTLDDGIVVPLGKPKQDQHRKGALLYNEYIVYNVDQIRMRYVLQVTFNFKR
ncbi:poly [ADP-ribose] polymerase 2-like [Cucurbita moschata]|uniref:Poly [ADP-ribose] polymerase n=1 Tax=Cucurbita moschata TaxID=3662 RepID=A0A6J1GP27_CUCMO|nr:poly [ADP-ribose] polymerase 2-like [Cucurbita moschata]